MPKSKRAKVVSLTKTQSRGRARKTDLMDTVQKCCDDYKYIYVFSCDNMRSDPLKRLRTLLSDDRILFGKNKVVKLAMGRNREEEYLPGLHQLAEVLKGDVGILFTNRTAKEIEKIFNEYSELGYARAGFKATKTINLDQGPINGQPSSMYEPLRKMLLPVKLNKGVVELETDHTVCKKGEIISPEQAQVLKTFDIKLAKFTPKLTYRFRDGHLTKLTKDDDVQEQDDDEEDDDMQDDEEDF